MSSGHNKKVILRVGTELRIATCGFADETEANAVAKWESPPTGETSQEVRDAAEFGALASKHWHYFRRQNACVTSINELQRRIAADRLAEVALLAVVKADWFKPGILGICHFRRTWYNSLFVDFLSNHPEVAAKKDPKIGGVGINLLGFVVKVADEIQAPSIWGEATSDSSHFYQKVFQLRQRTDAFRLSKRHYRTFLQQITERQVDMASELIPVAVKRIEDYVAKTKDSGSFPTS